MEETIKRICADCLESKDSSNFYRRVNYNDSTIIYYNSYCKECSRKRCKSYRQTEAGKAATAKGTLKYNHTKKGKLKAKQRYARYRAKQHSKERARLYEQLPEVRNKRSQWKKSIAGKISAANYAHGRKRNINRTNYKLTIEDWNEIQAKYNYCCAYCHLPVKNPTIDHIVPLSRGGLHEYSNLAPACGPCNKSKGPKLLTEWSGRKL